MVLIKTLEDIGGRSSYGSLSADVRKASQVFVAMKHEKVAELVWI